MLIIAEEKKFDKLSSLQDMLSHVGKLIAAGDDRLAYSYKGKIWEFTYRTRFEHMKIVKDCLLEVKDWEDYPKHESDDNRFSTEDIIKAIYNVRPVIRNKIRDITWDVPDAGDPDALEEGLRFNNTYGIFLSIRRGYHKNITDNVFSVVEASILDAANRDWYYQHEKEY